ncbi:MAG TPA: inorganic phosphate transporter, partial [Amaricoccus sp.]|nr:inorganic phosphate transporter [Amaricoccus sp.]
VFGVGFLREYLKVSYARKIEEIRSHHHDADQTTVEAFLERFDAASVDQKGRMLAELKAARAGSALHKAERKDLRRLHRIELVKRSLLLRIAAAWVITVPATALAGAMFFFMIRGALLP